MLPNMAAFVESIPAFVLVAPYWMQPMAHSLHPLLESIRTGGRLF